MTGAARVLTAVSFMGPVTISSCSEIRETQRRRDGKKFEKYSHSILVKCMKFGHKCGEIKDKRRMIHTFADDFVQTTYLK